MSKRHMSITWFLMRFNRSRTAKCSGRCISWASRIDASLRNDRVRTRQVCSHETRRRCANQLSKQMKLKFHTKDTDNLYENLWKIYDQHAICSYLRSSSDSKVHVKVFFSLIFLKTKRMKTPERERSTCLMLDRSFRLAARASAFSSKFSTDV